MVISELMAKLQEIKAEHGDLPIYTDLDDGFGDSVGINIVVREESPYKTPYESHKPLRVFIW